MCKIIVKSDFNKHVMQFHQKVIRKLYLQGEWSLSESERMSYKTPMIKNVCPKSRSLSRITGELKMNRINSPCNDKKETHKTSSTIPHALHAKKWFYFKKDFTKTWTECSEKWSEFHTCRGCEDEVNRKCPPTKPQEVVHVENEC